MFREGAQRQGRVPGALHHRLRQGHLPQDRLHSGVWPAPGIAVRGRWLRASGAEGAQEREPELCPGNALCGERARACRKGARQGARAAGRVHGRSRAGAALAQL